MKTDTRQLRRKHGVWTAGGKPVCDLCTVQNECGISIARTRLACEVMIPAFGFMTEAGLDRVSNTMRVGKAWGARLIPGDRVGLYHVKRQALFGSAQILSVFTGPIVPMILAHSAANHTMLNEPHDQAPATLLRWLRQNYGPRLINSHTHLTAVYLLNDGNKPLPIHLSPVQEDRDAEVGAQDNGLAGGDAGGSSAAGVSEGEASMARSRTLDPRGD